MAFVGFIVLYFGRSAFLSVLILSVVRDADRMVSAMGFDSCNLGISWYSMPGREYIDDSSRRVGRLADR